MNNNNNTLNNLADTAREAFGHVQSACPEDAKVIGTYLGALHKKNVMALGEGEAFVLTDAEGRSIKATKRIVRLSAENGGLTQPVWSGPFVISAPGYGMLAHAAGAVGCAVRERQALLRECGFTRFCTFEGRRPVWHSL